MIKGKLYQKGNFMLLYWVLNKFAKFRNGKETTLK